MTQVATGAGEHRSLGERLSGINLADAKFWWALTLVTVPFTSFPWLPLGEAVSPLSVVFLPIVLWFGLGSRSRRRRLFDSPFRLLLLFAFVALASTVLNLALGAGPVAGADLFGVDDRAMSAFADVVTLLIGLGFYAAAITMTVDEGELRFTLRWLMIGLGINVAVAIVQGILLQLFPSIEEPMHSLTSLVAIDNGARAWRAYGLTLEPSWLASQLTLLGVPVALLWSLNPSGVRKWLIRGRVRSLLLHPAWVLFFLLLTALVLSFSRAGLLVCIVCLLIVAVLRFVALRTAKDVFVSVVVLPVAVVAVAVGSLASSYVRAAVGSAVQIVTHLGDTEVLIQAVGAAGVGGRVAFWVIGFNTFLDSPVTGVGLGQSPFYFYGNVPDWASSDLEVLAYTSGAAAGLPNAKNMFVRVLSETGIVGGVVFALFVLKHYFYALTSRRLEVIAFALLVGAALAMDFLNLDTFALPHIWYALALVWALSRIKREKHTDPEE